MRTAERIYLLLKQSTRVAAQAAIQIGYLLRTLPFLAFQRHDQWKMVELAADLILGEEDTIQTMGLGNDADMTLKM
jgi:hypothetical protein